MVLNQFKLDKKVDEFIRQIESERPDVTLNHETFKSSIMGLLYAEYQGHNSHADGYFSQILLQLGLLDETNKAVFSEITRQIDQRDYLGQGPDVDAFLRRVHEALPHYDPKRNSVHAVPDPKPK